MVSRKELCEGENLACGSLGKVKDGMLKKLMPSVASMQFTEAREVFQILLELSGLLCTGLTPDQLTTCIRLCEAGVNPEALAIIVRELQKEASKSPASAADNNIVRDNNNQNL